MNECRMRKKALAANDGAQRAVASIDRPRIRESLRRVHESQKYGGARRATDCSIGRRDR
jgi:hypothetical protein